MNKKERQLERLSPRKFVDPLQYQQWKIIGLINEVANKSQTKKRKSQVAKYIKLYYRNIPGTIGLLLFFILLIAILIIPETTKYDPTIVDLEHRNINAFDDNYVLGTTETGIDIWAQLWHGARYSLALSTTSAFLILIIGTTIGLFMGYYPKFGKIMMYLILIMQNIPTLPLLIILILIYGSNFGIIILVFALTSWIGLALQVRAQVLRAKELEWVMASKVLGTKAFRIIWSLLPRAVPIILTVMVFSIPGFIIAEITLGVLGLLTTTQPSLGIMINDAITTINTDPSKLIIPSIILIVLTTSLMLIGNGIQETLKRTR